MYNVTSNHPIINTILCYCSKPEYTFQEDSRFLCILNGSLSILIHSKEYILKKSDVIYIPSETTYTLIPEEPSILMFVCFHPFFLLETLGYQYLDIHCNSTKTSENNNTLNTYLANLAIASLGQSEENRLYMYAKAYEFLHFISGHYIKSSDPLTTENTKTSIKLSQLEHFISKNYMNPISLSDVATALDYTPQYLSNFIKKHFQMTFQEYLNNFRMEAALLLIKHSKDNIARISLSCGFPNQASFVSNFCKKYHQKPEEYREQLNVTNSHSGQSELIPITNIALLKDYIFNYVSTTENNASLYEDKIIQYKQVNVMRRNPVKHYWNFLINIGSAADFDKPALRNHLRMMQKDLSFQYGRCYGILSLAKVYQLGQEKTYDFSKIFDIIDFLKSIHMKPFFELGNKPFTIYKVNEFEYPSYDMFLNSKLYDSFLFDILPNFIKACFIRYGFDEFSTWKFELWRRYNPNMTSLESPEDYCRRFQQTAQIMKTLVPDTALGGPGYNSFLDISDLEHILEAFHNAEYEPDFISAYFFPFIAEKSKDNQTISGYTTAQSANIMLNKVNEINAVLDKCGFSHVPIYITEFSSYLATGNYINDSTYPAVYILHQINECYNKVKAIGYWVASDISLDYDDSSAPLFGGNGIISKDGIRKAGYYAFEFLNKLGNQLIDYGEHYLITATENNMLQILVYYHSNLNSDFARSPKNQELLLYPYSAFEDILPLDFQLNLTHMTSGTYSIKEVTLDLKHGNILNTWGQLNHIKNIHSMDVEYMKTQSTPSVQVKIKQITDTYLLHTVLNYNEAKLFTFDLYL